MPGRDLLIITGPQVRSLLEGRESDVLEAVELAYREHARGATSLPHSTFLLFPRQPRDRIIALPAYLGGDDPVAGVKWIASFPENSQRGLDRASAVLVLNSTETGVPETFLESSIISAKRTAASAALAAKHLVGERPPSTVGLIGCGPINAEILRFVGSIFPVRSVLLFDKAEGKADTFAARVRGFLPRSKFTVAGDPGEVLAGAPLVSFATTAAEPHVNDLSACPPGATILHVSLRDLSVAAILASDNVVDDVDHVARARTSVHLAEMETKGRGFVRATLGEILERSKPARRDERTTVVFSPFGIGILDLAVGRLVRRLAVEKRMGSRVADFLPEPFLGDPTPLQETESVGRGAGWPRELEGSGE